MNTGNWARSTKWMRALLAAGLAIGLGSGIAFSQTAGQDMKNAGQNTKAAAQDAGHATKQGSKTAYRKTKRGTKKAYYKTENGAKTAGRDTETGAKETGRRTQNAGDAVAGKPEQH